MADDPKHTKIRTFTELPDGSIQVITESYFDKLASIKEEIVKQIKTDRSNFYTDLISSADVIYKQQTKELTLRIYSNEWNQVDRIVKEYTVKKENFNKR